MASAIELNQANEPWDGTYQIGILVCRTPVGGKMAADTAICR
jgi:hypothetical protein